MTQGLELQFVAFVLTLQSNTRIDSDPVCVYLHVHVPYSGKFSWGPIFADGQSPKFSRFNFRGCGQSCPLYTVQSYLFRKSNFRG
jgi:hypothetical protein